LAYELDKERYVLVEPAELKKMQPASSSVAEIVQFVRIDEVVELHSIASASSFTSSTHR
jgi:non-homologous end joining protein Ku